MALLTKVAAVVEEMGERGQGLGHNCSGDGFRRGEPALMDITSHNAVGEDIWVVGSINNGVGGDGKISEESIATGDELRVGSVLGDR